MSHHLHTKQAKYKPSYGGRVPISGEPGSRAGLASGTSLLGFAPVFLASQGLCFQGGNPPHLNLGPSDLGLASESGDSDFQLSL